MQGFVGAYRDSAVISTLYSKFFSLDLVINVLFNFDWMLDLQVRAQIACARAMGGVQQATKPSEAQQSCAVT